jgi:two-component system response regulator AgrA
MLNKLFIKHNIDAMIKFKTDNTSNLLNYITNNSVDVLFLDISLKDKINGLKIAEKIRKINKNLNLIFTTGHFEYVMEAYKVNTFDYLVKPISQEKLEETLLRLIDYIQNPTNNFLKINGTTFIKKNDIQYIQKDRMKVIFHTKKGEYFSYNSFLKLQETLPDNFIRCHKSYIVNTSNINHVESCNNTIFFTNKDKCFIGPKYKNNFMEVIKNEQHPINLDRINYT